MKKKYRNSIEEIRAIKENMARQAHYDPEKFMQLVKETTTSYKKKLTRKHHTLHTGTDG